jgi:hypothetical protein
MIKLMLNLIMEIIVINVHNQSNILNLVNSELIVDSLKLINNKEDLELLLTQSLLLKLSVSI